MNVAKIVELTDQEAELVGNVLQWWLDGLPDAKEATIDDGRTLDTMDKMLDACSGLSEQEDILTRVKEKLDV